MKAESEKVTGYVTVQQAATVRLQSKVSYSKGLRKKGGMRDGGRSSGSSDGEGGSKGLEP